MGDGWEQDAVPPGWPSCPSVLTTAGSEPGKRPSPGPGPSKEECFLNPSPGQGCVGGTGCYRGATVVHIHTSGLPNCSLQHRRATSTSRSDSPPSNFRQPLLPGAWLLPSLR